MKDYESAIAKARALAALADPQNGGAPGEIENAQTALKRHLEKHGLTDKDINPELRTRRALECVSRSRNVKPVKEPKLTELAVQCLAYITGGGVRMTYRVEDYFTPQRGLKPDKLWRIFVCYAELTDREHSEWQECFQHYLPSFLESVAELRAKSRAANRALKNATLGFCYKHELFAPSTNTSGGKPMSPEDICSIISAMQSARGDTWVRKSGVIEDGFLLKQPEPSPRYGPTPAHFRSSSNRAQTRRPAR